MLDVRPIALGEEVRQAEEYTKARMGEADTLKARYMGGKGRWDPENVYFEYVSRMTPRVVYDNPRARLNSRRGGAATFVADGLRHTINRQIRDHDLRSVLTPVCIDMFFSFGVTLTTQRPVPGMAPMERFIAAPITQRDIRWERVGSDGFGHSQIPVARNPKRRKGKVQPHGPRTYRLSPKRYFQDPQALTPAECRFRGHWGVRDIQDAIAEAKADRDKPEEERQGWNLELLEGLGAASARDVFGDSEHAFYADRNQFVYREVWVPELSLDDEHTPEEGYHGVIYTICEDASQKTDADGRWQYLRAPRAYYGPPDGPYDLFGMYPVPDESLPLSALQAAESQIRELNKHANAMSESSARYKRMVLVDASDPQTQEIIANGEHDMVLPVPGLAAIAQGQKVIPVEVGGITEQMLEHFAVIKERVDRMLALSDALMGNVTGTGTATENAIADASASVQLDFIRSQFAVSTKSLLTKWAWYDYHDDRVLVPLGPEAAQEMGLEAQVVMGPDGPVTVPPDPWFQGGTYGEPSTHSFEDLELEIEPYSLERTTESTLMRNAALLDNTLQMVAQMGPFTATFIDWKGYLEDRGRMLNMPDVGRRINAEAMAEAAQQQLAQPTTASKPQPTSARDQIGGGGPGQRPQAVSAGRGSPKVGAQGGGSQNGSASQ